MKCVNCGHENLEKALICYWCSLDPVTGDSPFPMPATPASLLQDSPVTLQVPALPVIDVPPTLPVPEFPIADVSAGFSDLAMPTVPEIEIAPLPDIPDRSEFAVVRRRTRHRPVVRAYSASPMTTHALLPGWARLFIFVGGLGVLFLLGSALVTGVAAGLGGIVCLSGLLGLFAVLWLGLLLARRAKRIITRTGAALERVEFLGRSLYETVPGTIKEVPVNLSTQLGVLDVPVSYSELRALADDKSRPVLERSVDLVTGAIVDLIGRDDIVLARQTYPVETRGLLTRNASEEMVRPVLTRRRAYVGPGQLEAEIAKVLRTDQGVTVGELVHKLAGSTGGQDAKRIVAWVDQALDDSPPNLEALASPDQALQDFQQFREALQRADPELYQLVEKQVRQGLGALAQRPVPSSLLNLARYTASADRTQQAGDRPRGDVQK
jgi:hypothetical protein